MDDLIRRQDAIDAVKNWIKSEEFRWSNATYYMEKRINNIPSAQKWIPCSERLPEEEVNVLVTRRFLGVKDCGNGCNYHIPTIIYVEVAQFFGGEWTALSDEYKVARSRHTDPIAWMPLPKPYKAPDQERDCEHCVHHTDKGCSSWNCEFERRTE